MYGRKKQRNQQTRLGIVLYGGIQHYAVTIKRVYLCNQARFRGGYWF